MRAALLVGAAVLAVGAPARAQSDLDLVSPSTLSGLLDVRLGGATGETSFRDGGFGKLRYGDGKTASQALQLGQAALAWQPRFDWNWSAVVHAQVSPDPHAEKPVDIVQAYALYKSSPGPTRVSARFGYFYPPVSLEHDGATWTVTNTITPSAINTWIGEEVKVGGAEASVSHAFGGHELSASAALFGWNDTSGTLLTFRGWALHDLQSGASTSYDLPPLSPFMTPRQASETYPGLEIDGRTGYYGRLDWRLPERAEFNLFYYDNGGDRTSVRNLQWAWDTRFWNAGASIALDDRTQLLAQALTGETWMGFVTSRGIMADVAFSSAYVLVTRAYGQGALTGRIDYFRTDNRSSSVLENDNERGWAATAAYRYRFSPHLTWLDEVLYVSSNRPGRAYAGETPVQAQTQVQTAIRLSF